MASSRNFYVILGVKHRESPSGIRSAFRELARRYHPDRAGPKGTAFFQEIVEAYQTLSDPIRRAAYDRALQNIAAEERPTVVRVSPPPRPTAVEPLIPEPLLPQPVSLMRDFEVTRPAVEEVYDRIRRNFVAPERSRSGQVETLGIDVFLRPETALRGGVLTLGVPVFYPCPVCRGAGRGWAFSCLNCRETGMVEEEQPVRLQLPAGVPDNTVIQVPLRGLGIHNLQLVVRVRVTDTLG